jgi:hypothetical protein
LLVSHHWLRCILFEHHFATWQ